MVADAEGNTAGGFFVKRARARCALQSPATHVSTAGRHVWPSRQWSPATSSGLAWPYQSHQFNAFSAARTLPLCLTQHAQRACKTHCAFKKEPKAQTASTRPKLTSDIFESGGWKHTPSTGALPLRRTQLGGMSGKTDNSAVVRHSMLDI